MTRCPALVRINSKKIYEVGDQLRLVGLTRNPDSNGKIVIIDKVGRVYKQIHEYVQIPNNLFVASRTVNAGFL